MSLEFVSPMSLEYFVTYVPVWFIGLSAEVTIGATQSGSYLCL